MTKEQLKEYKDILNKVKEYLENLTEETIETELHNDLDLFLQKLNISREKYEAALSISERGKVVILTRLKGFSPRPREVD